MSERWEYRVLETTVSNEWWRRKRERKLAELQGQLDALGAEGWELVGYGAAVVPSSLTSVGLCFLKRRAADLRGAVRATTGGQTP